jgi:hypothetical protein
MPAETTGKEFISDGPKSTKPYTPVLDLPERKSNIQRFSVETTCVAGDHGQQAITNALPGLIEQATTYFAPDGFLTSKVEAEFFGKSYTEVLVVLTAEREGWDPLR